MNVLRKEDLKNNRPNFVFLIGKNSYSKIQGHFKKLSKMMKKHKKLN